MPPRCEEQRQRRSRDAAADDDGAMCVCHAPTIGAQLSFPPVMIDDGNHHERESVGNRPEPVPRPARGPRRAQRHARGGPPARDAVSGEQRARAAPLSCSGIRWWSAAGAGWWRRRVASSWRRSFAKWRSGSRWRSIAAGSSPQRARAPSRSASRTVIRRPRCRASPLRSRRALPQATLRVVSTDYLAATNGLTSGDVDDRVCAGAGGPARHAFERPVRGARHARRPARSSACRPAHDARTVQRPSTHRRARRPWPSRDRPPRCATRVGGGARPAPARRPDGAVTHDRRRWPPPRPIASRRFPIDSPRYASAACR